MESKQETVKRFASGLGISRTEIESMMDKGISLDEIYSRLIEVFKNLEAQKEEGFIKSKRRKPTNYTKPRSRKKKPKNKRR